MGLFDLSPDDPTMNRFLKGAQCMSTALQSFDQVMPNAKEKTVSKKKKRAREEQPPVKDSSEISADVSKKAKKSVKPLNKKQIDSDAPSNLNLTPLQKKMAEKLHGGRFRFINEQLYTSDGRSAFRLFQKEPHLFDEYHRGFRSQVEGWPSNPLDMYIRQVDREVARLVLKPQEKDREWRVVDMGCGEARLARTIYEKYPLEPTDQRVQITSIDLVARNEFITAANMAQTGLKTQSADWVIFCLSLMGTDYEDFIREANRLLKPKTGWMKITEVKSRFPNNDVDAFIQQVQSLGFQLKKKDDGNTMFVSLAFLKSRDSPPRQKEGGPKLPALKPCQYKRR